MADRVASRGNRVRWHLLLTTSQAVLSIYQEQQPLRSQFGHTARAAAAVPSTSSSDRDGGPAGAGERSGPAKVEALSVSDLELS